VKSFGFQLCNTTKSVRQKVSRKKKINFFSNSPWDQHEPEKTTTKLQPKDAISANMCDIYHIVSIGIGDIYGKTKM